MIPKFVVSLFPYLALLLICSVSYCLWHLVIFFRFQRFLHKKMGRRFNGDLRALIFYIFSRDVGGPWVASKKYETLFLEAVIIFVWGIVQALDTNDATNFSRAGSLIVIVGLYGVFFGFRQYASLFNQQQQLNPVVASENRLTYQEISQTSSSIVIFLITSIGTLIWGYGDLLIKPFIHQVPVPTPSCPIVCLANINREETLIQEQARQIESINGIVQTMEKEISTIQRQIASLQKSVCELEKQRKPPPPSPRKPIHHRHKFRDSSKSSVKPQFPCSQG